MRKDRVVNEVLGEEIAVTPSDLYSADFKTALFGGYDRNEVDTLLERTADVFEMLLGQVRELKAQIDELKEDVESFRERESTLRNALASTQKHGENIVEAAHRQADAITQEAKLIRTQAVAAAAEMPARMREETEALRAARDRLRGDLLALIETHRGLVEAIPVSEVRPLSMEALLNEDEESAPVEKSDIPEVHDPVPTPGEVDSEEEGAEEASA